jgi:DNA-binding CsgD family transcriptional regulator
MDEDLGRFLPPLDAVAEGMPDASEADRAAILAVIREETDAWLQRDFAGLVKHWLHSPQTRRMEYYASLGVRVDEGWEAIGARLKTIMERFPDKYGDFDNIRWDKVNIVAVGDMAWVTYDQIGIDGGGDLKRELKILHRVPGGWKIACMVMMEATVEQASCPLIEIDADARILWTNELAKERLISHPGLIVTAGRLCARRRDDNLGFRATVRLAFHELRGQTRLAVSPKQAWAVALGDDESGIPMHCWIRLEDGRALVSFDDAEAVSRRISSAADIYGLSPAQTRLARLIVDGHDLAAAAQRLSVSVNTLRTQLQRIYDKTGVRNQAALVRSLLSIDTPNT